MNNIEVNCDGCDEQICGTCFRRNRAEERIEELETEVAKLRQELAKTELESTSETCRRKHVQLCAVCDDLDCCDNMSSMKDRLRQLDALDADHSRLYCENIWLRHELIKQTGCSLEEIDECMQVPDHKPVVNRRMGEALRERFKVEDDRDDLVKGAVPR